MWWAPSCSLLFIISTSSIIVMNPEPAIKQINTARAAVSASGNVVNKTQKAAEEAVAALEAAIAALGVVGEGGKKNADAKVKSLTEIEQSVNTLLEQVTTLDGFVDGDKFLNGKFGFKPNSNINRTINETNLTSALTALKTISKNLATNKINETLNGSTSAMSPTRQEVINALLGGVRKFTENVKSNHIASLSDAQAKAAAAKAAAAKAKADATAANAKKTEHNQKLKSLSNQAILNFNRSLKELVDTASNAMKESPVEANGGLVLQEGKNS